MKKIIIPAILFVIILASGIWVLGKANKPAENTRVVPTPTTVLPTIPDSVSVSLTAKNSNRIVVLNISGIPEGTRSIEYELTYTTSAGLPRGVLGKIMVEGAVVERDDIVLGTCSSGKCVYDTGVESIDLSLKFNSEDGSVAVFRKTFPLE